jgi:hypothetical protein
MRVMSSKWFSFQGENLVVSRVVWLDRRSVTVHVITMVRGVQIAALQVLDRACVAGWD